MIEVSAFPTRQILDYKEEPQTDCTKPLTFLFVLFIIEAVALTLAWYFNASTTHLICLGTLGTIGILAGWSLAVFTQKTLNNMHKRKTTEYTTEKTKEPSQPTIKTSSLVDAVLNNDLDLVKTLLQEANPNEQNETGITPLHAALTIHHNVKIALILLQNGADPNLATNESCSYPCLTPYQLLFYKGHYVHEQPIILGEGTKSWISETYHWIPLSEENIPEERINFCLIKDSKNQWLKFTCSRLPTEKLLTFKHFHQIHDEKDRQELLDLMLKKGAKFPENPFEGLKEYSSQPLSS